jgi:hypothetical protein
MMNVPELARALGVSLSLAATCVALPAYGQSKQTLDRVDVYNNANVLDMEFEDPARTFDFSVFNVTPVTGFTACQHMSLTGLFCLDGQQVRRWADPKTATGNGDLVLSCADPTLGFDMAKGGCTGMAVELSGAFWLAGKKGNGYALIKVVRKNPNIACTSAQGTALQQALYCARVYVSDRVFIGDLSALDGDLGAALKIRGGVTGPGVLAIENQQDVVFYRNTAGAAPVVIATGKQWGLAGNEKLLSATLLQMPVAGQTRNFALATTSNHRLLASDTEALQPTASQVFDIVAQRNAVPVPPAQCNTLTQQYGLRASTKSGRVYLTDRNFCQAVALKSRAMDAPPGPVFPLVNVQENLANLSFPTQPYAPAFPTITPGIVIDLSTCAGTCTMLSKPSGDPAATLSSVKLVGSQTDMVLFQIKGIPDCRYIPSPQPAVCSLPNVIVNDPAGQFLNVTPMLPKEITDLFDASGAPPGGLPRMLISPQYRGQAQNGFVFEAFFGITEPGVQFTDVFSGEWDIAALAGAELGCGDDFSEALKPNRKWDVVTTVSEKYITAGGPGLITDTANPNRYVDTLANTGCGTTVPKGGRWSLWPYNLEITPNTDAVFAKLLVSLYNDFEETRAELACKQVDTTGAPPLAAGVCSTLASQWANGKDKLDKCISASTKPKQSSGSQNCSGFQSQLTNIGQTVNSAVATGPDPANRVGELRARWFVLGFVNDRFLNSIPANGFTNQ